VCLRPAGDSFTVHGRARDARDGTSTRRDPAKGFPFSMKDLALPVSSAGATGSGRSCFKVEGRKKSPLYVATTTDYYRKLIDGTMPEGEARAA